QEPESGLDPWPEVAEAEPEQNASIGDVVDASRLVSDAVPAGLELTLAIDNADLGPPLSTGSRAVYVGQANTATMSVTTFESIDSTQIEKELSSYSGAVTSNVNGVEVVVLGDGFRQAMFEAGSRSFSISGSLHIGADPLSDEELLAAARTIIEHSEPTVFPDELLGFTLAGVEATVGFDHPSEYPHMDGASPDGSTTVYSGPETADRNFGPSVEIQVRPAIDGAYIPYEVLLGPDGELIDLAGIPALITATESALVADEEGWVRRQPITDEEVRSLHVRLGDHQITIFAYGLDRQQLIDFALALRTATDAEWGVGLS
ncbi:MAG: hypothetical protein GY724_17655, partial [Actinomycetia bacterium]|nr:hypothetical protein [Actinomycetes bacterium]